MERRLDAIELYDCLHGCRARRGTGTGVIEAKLAQQLSYLELKPFYGVFVDLKKAFDSMDRERCIMILEGYRAGPRMIWLIRGYWRDAIMVCRALGNYGTPFKAGRGVTQGGPLSAKLFNIMVDAVAREWLRELREGGDYEVWELDEGCAETLADPYKGKTPLPRVPNYQEPFASRHPNTWNARASQYLELSPDTHNHRMHSFPPIATE